MISVSRALLLFSVATVQFCPLLVAGAEAQQEDKEKASEKSLSRPQTGGPSQPVPESQPPPPKISTETKPESQASPPAKVDAPPDREIKEKETPKKSTRSLILSVKLALLADYRLFSYEIEAEEDQQTITLAGRVSSEQEIAAASDIARTVPGVKAVVNKLEVVKGLAQALTKKQDDIITLLIKERFAKSATLKATNFEVKTEEGVVSLSGVVRFQVIALEAAETARQVPGVKAVRTDKVRLEGEG